MQEQQYQQEPQEFLCVSCKGKGLCGRPCRILEKLKEFQPKISNEFSGSSPPEIFVGRHNYPCVNAGILSPAEFGETEIFSMPELWHSKNSSIADILSFRSRMIYSRFKSDINSANLSSISKSSSQKILLSAMQEVAMAARHADMEFKLEKKPQLKFHLEQRMPMIGNPANLRWVRFTENVKIERKVEYLVNDFDNKAVNSINELHSAKIPTSSIIKLLSAGLLGERKNRKLVPTRWAITAVDSNISEIMLEKIRYHPQISEFLLFNSEYLGNHYEILLLPEAFSFEVIEAWMPRTAYNNEGTSISQDFESWHGRKGYAENVTGGYYAVRLPVCEYLARVKKQASALVLRESRPEYWAPCGVGVLRECARDAMQKKPECFASLQEALKAAQKRMKLSVSIFTKESKILSEHRKQLKLREFFK